MKKRLGLLTIIVVFVAMICLPVLTSCNTGDVNELRIALDVEDEGRYDEIFDFYTEKTGIKIEATYGQDVSKLVGTKSEPDIIKTSTVVVSSMKDSLLDLTDLINADDEINTDNYLDNIMEPLIIDGKIYALPTSINTSLLYYNKKIFDENADELRKAFNLEENESVYPKDGWSYDDYKKAGLLLSKYTIGKDGKRKYSQFGAESQMNWWGELLVYVNQMGGSFYKEGSNNKICDLNSPEAIKATEFFVNKSIGDETQKFSPDAVEASAAFSFLNNNVAMIFGGHMGDWYSYDLLNLDWDVQVLPTPNGNPNEKGGEISADAFGISVRSKKIEAAFEFLKLWTGEKGALQMYKFGKVGALKNMEELIQNVADEDKKDINMEAVFKAMKRAETLPNEKDFSKVAREMVMTEIYKLMYTGRGSESDVTLVMNRIKENVDNYYAGLID